MLAAICAGDADEARRIMSSHILLSLEVFLKTFRAKDCLRS